MLIEDMMQADVNHFRKEKLLKESGYVIKNQFE
jgi:GDPmannose 4,6-dehydratase